MKFVCHLVLIFVSISAGSTALANDNAAFSSLPEPEQKALRQMVATLPPEQRHSCYSTPMYYLFHEGFEYRGDNDRDPEHRPHPNMVGMPLTPDYGHWRLDRNRPDWQEAIIKDWSELGMGNTHLNIYPQNESLELSETYVKAIEDFARLSDQYHLKIGVRLDGIGGYEAWPLNPVNPDNQIAAYLDYVRKVATLLKGKTLYYVLGDEMTLVETGPNVPDRAWTAEKYMTYFKQVAKAIREVDPGVKVSMFAVADGHRNYVFEMLKAGYADHGDAITINANNFQEMQKFFAEVRKLAPKMVFLSNGVGYIAAAKAQPPYPKGTPYKPEPTDEAHGGMVAKTMFSWWDVGAMTAPYYVCLRDWDIRGKIYPAWYGIFGFEEFVVDDADKLTVRRLPGWYAFQTIAHTFYNREDFVTPLFEVKCAPAPTQFRCYEHKLASGSELLIVMWNDSAETEVEVSIGSKKYFYPVRISLFDKSKWTDVPYTVDDTNGKLRVSVGSEPVIIRLFGVQ